MAGTAPWTVEQVAALAPSPAQFAAADGVADPRRWTGLGDDDGALWGRYVGGQAEPYDVAVDVAVAKQRDGEPGWRCSCPSRKTPCKHVLGLMLLWVRQGVPAVARGVMPATVQHWVERGRAGAGPSTDAVPPSSPTSDQPTEPVGNRDAPADGPEPSRAPGPLPEPPDRDERDERVARMRAGLLELSRWLEDRMRTGLSDPALARLQTWEGLAARLVDAQVGALANRVRRISGLVGAGPDWHDALLAEMGILHLLARAGRHIPELPADLGDGVATAIGWQVRHATVLAGVPDTDVWDVAGRSDRREDRIEVRRTWLRGRGSGRWAMVLSFAAYHQSLDTSLPVGSVVDADLHRFPGSGLRALVGARRDDAVMPHRVDVSSVCGVTDAAIAVGMAVIGEPWTEHVPVLMRAALTNDAGRWVLADGDGALPCVADDRTVAAVLAATGGGPTPMTVEWTPPGFVPLAVHLHDRSLDVGPRAAADFVGVA